MKNMFKFLSISLFMYPLFSSAMEPEKNVQDSWITYNNQDIEIYTLLSSLSQSQESPSWLPREIMYHIANDMHDLSELCYEMGLRGKDNLLDGLGRLNMLCKLRPDTIALLLKANLNAHKTSLIKKDDEYTHFDFSHPVFIEEVKILCSVVDKKAFVDHFKKTLYGTFKTNNLHRLMYNYHSETKIMELYCTVFINYAQNCPKKSKEVVDLLEAKDSQGKTVLDIAHDNNLLDVAITLTDTIQKLKDIIKKKEPCSIQ